MDRRLLVAAALAASLVLAIVVVRLVSPSGAPTAEDLGSDPESTTSTFETPHPDAAARDELSEFPRTPVGAVAAATAHGLALDGPAAFEPEHRAEVLDDIAADASRDELTAVFDNGLGLVREQLFLDQQAVSDPGFVWRVVPGGWQLRSYDRTQATVAVWAAVVVMTGDRPLVEPGWQTTQVELTWERDAWRLVRFATEPGPDPLFVGSGGEPVGQRINAFHPYRHWPHPADAEADR